MQALAVRMLGAFEVDGLEQRQLGSRKARTFLRLLALGRRSPVPVDVLVDAVWPEGPPLNPADQLSVLASRLRGVLGRDRLLHADGGYVLRYDRLDVDDLAALVGETERRHAAGARPAAAAAARVALSLVRGDPQAEVPPGEWAADRLSEITRLIAAARRVASAAFEAAGQWLDAADVAAELVRTDPYDEAAVRTLMRCSVAASRGGAALAAYAELRGRLADELGTEPERETQSLHEAVLRGEVVTSAVEQPVQVVVGREHQLLRLHEVAAQAQTNGPRVVVLDGDAGIGKTTLLRTWAAQRAAAGDVVISAACSEVDRSVALDSIFVALSHVLRELGAERTREVLGREAELLAPLLTPGVVADIPLADRGFEPAAVFAALTRVLTGLRAHSPVVIVIDDAHFAGPALSDWLQFVRRRSLPVTVVAAYRSGEGVPLPSDVTLRLGPLDRESVAALLQAPADDARVDQLYALTQGHPLFLTQLAGSDGAALPASLVDAVSRRCDELGDAGETVRAAAVIGARLDLDLLAGVLDRPVVEVLQHAEQAVTRQLLVDDDGVFWFHHDLVRAALATATAPTRASLLHREAGRVLARRADSDPLDVADHAHLGGDALLAAESLRLASVRAAARFDLANAETLLDRSLAEHDDTAGRLDRARVRALRSHFSGAYDDIEHALDAGAAAMEVGAWASYFDRRFAQAAQYAADGELVATDDVHRARCLAVGGRTKHAAGDLVTAERLLAEAVTLSAGPDRVSASAWLGVIRAHQSRVDEALELMRAATRGRPGVEHTSATLHALLFTGQAHALAGRPAAALASFEQYTAEVERRHVPRFSGRGVNSAGWVLRNIGAADEAVERHHEALEAAGRTATAEVTIAALEDLAEDALTRGEIDGAWRRLEEAESSLVGDLVFGWRLDLKLRLLQGRVALARGDAVSARMLAKLVSDRASTIGVPRYLSVGRLLGHCAAVRLGQPVDLDVVADDLDVLDRSVALEAWWWTGDMAAELHVPAWVNRAADRVEALAAASGERGDELRRRAAGRLDAWQAAAR